MWSVSKSNSMQFSSSEVVGEHSRSWDDKTSSTTGTYTPRFPETATKVWYRILLDMIIEKSLQKCLFAADWFVLQILLEWLCSQSSFVTTTQLFTQSLSSNTLCRCLEILSTTNNFSKFWHSKFQQVSTYAFCTWDDIFTQKWNCSSPKNLCKCTESPTTLATNTPIKWNLYLSWSNHLVRSCRLEMNVGGFSEHQNKTSGTDRYKGHFFITRISQVNVNSMKRYFEQRSELQVAKCLLVHILSSSYNFSRLELRNEKKTTQQRSLLFAHHFVLNQVRVYHERVYADRFIVKIWFVRSFSSQQYSKFITDNTSERVSQILTKRCKSRSSFCKVNLNFCVPETH